LVRVNSPATPESSQVDAQATGDKASRYRSDVQRVSQDAVHSAVSASGGTRKNGDGKLMQSVVDRRDANDIAAIAAYFSNLD